MSKKISQELQLNLGDLTAEEGQLELTESQRNAYRRLEFLADTKFAGINFGQLALPPGSLMQQNWRSFPWSH